ncbi:uncharacterized mitochondrial protein AtMg00810-like [Benincasa hispida]|uniref:uncharacterized mitochondrial protein AtMg00810-like n=1 Tax=Benincasa hispida TaxID=102211 RepID=UPI001901C532|nr:uncharacterized mitochondrial protein AtMg00810-like [Benincasa hispida]
MQDELLAMEANRPWSVMPLPQGQHSIGFKWIYKIKYRTDGTIDRYKAGSAQSFVALLVYIVDIVITGASLPVLHKIKDHLHEAFKLKDLGSLRYFLGLEIARSSQGILLSQRNYTLQLLEDHGLLACKPASLPLDSALKLQFDVGTLLSDATLYRRLIGRLLYLTISRPDIAFVVHKLSQFVAQPRQPRLDAAMSLLKYLKASPGQGILLQLVHTFQLKAYFDADWGSCPDSRKSITGFCIFLGDFIISWKAKKKSTVSRSSAKAEYQALAATISELLWVEQLLHELSVPLIHPSLIYCDNEATVHIAENPVFHERTKHIDCHFVRDHIVRDNVKLLPIRSHLQLADIFTKALPKTLFSSLLSKMGILDITTPS